MMHMPSVGGRENTFILSEAWLLKELPTVPPSHGEEPHTTCSVTVGVMGTVADHTSWTRRPGSG